jgi:hypothetical protein
VRGVTGKTIVLPQRPQRSAVVHGTAVARQDDTYDDTVADARCHAVSAVTRLADLHQTSSVDWS